MEYLSEEEYFKILDTLMDLELKAMCYILWETGIRVVELLDLRLTSFDFEKRIMIIMNKRKRNRKETYYRELPMNDELIETLQEFIESNYKIMDNRLFCYTPKTIISKVKAAAIEADISKTITPKLFRNGYTYVKIKQGVDLYRLNYLLGNVDMTKTRVYVSKFLLAA